MGLLKVALTVPFLVTSPTKFSRADYFLTQTFVIPFEYFRKLLWPVNLNIDIDFPVISELTRLGHFAGMAVLGLIVGVLIVIRDRWVRFGLAWGLITLIPTSSVMPLLDVAVEHRMYLPLVGLCLAVGGGICRLENAIHDGPLFTSIPRPVLLRCAWIGFFLIALGHASMTVDRNRIWKNEITLWADAKKKSPHSIRPLNNLGEAYDKIKLYDKAIVEFEGALKLNPRYTIGLSNIGNIYGKMGQYEKSKRYLRRAIEAEPDYAPAHYNLARALSLTGNREASKEHYAKALKYQPYFEEAWFNLAYIEFETGEFQQSVKHYKNFIEWRPRHPKAWYGLGLTYLGMKQFSDAALAFTKAIKFDPKYLSPRISLAGLYMKQRKNDQALTVYLQLIEDFGGIAGVHRNLGILYSEHKQDPVRAAYHFRESLRLEPLQPQAAEMQKLLLRLESEVIQNNSP